MSPNERLTVNSAIIRTTIAGFLEIVGGEEKIDAITERLIRSVDAQFVKPYNEDNVWSDDDCRPLDIVPSGTFRATLESFAKTLVEEGGEITSQAAQLLRHLGAAAAGDFRRGFVLKVYKVTRIFIGKGDPPGNEAEIIDATSYSIR